jgi:hypothetical protein
MFPLPQLLLLNLLWPVLFLPLALLGPQLLSWSAVSGIPAAAVVLTAFDVPGVPAVARVSAVAAVPIAVKIPSATAAGIP